MDCEFARSQQPDSLFAERTSESKSVRRKLGCEAMRLETPSKLISVTIWYCRSRILRYCGNFEVSALMVIVSVSDVACPSLLHLYTV